MKRPIIFCILFLTGCASSPIDPTHNGRTFSELFKMHQRALYHFEQTNAEIALVEFGKGIIPLLIENLKSRRYKSRISAAKILGEFGPEAHTAIPVLVNALEDENNLVRENAARALGDICRKPESEVPLFDDSEHVNTARAPGSIDERAESIIPHLLKAMKDEEPNVRSLAVYALLEIGVINEVVLAAMIEGYKDTATRVRERIVEHIDEIAPDAGSAITWLLDAMNDQDMCIGRIAIGNLYEVIDSLGPEDKEALPEILEVLKLPDKSLKVSALWALGQIAQEVDAPIQTLVGMLSHRDASLREVALRVLGSLGSRAVTAMYRIAELLSDSDWIVRTSAVTALGDIGKGAEPLIPAILSAIEFNDWRFKKAAAEAIEKIEG
jgi:HEAT repeat protein